MKKTRGVRILVALLGAVLAAQVADARPFPRPSPVRRGDDRPGDQRDGGRGDALLRVFVGRSIVVSSAEALSRVAVTNPEIASATIITPHQVLVHGHTPGGVTLILWDDKEQMQSHDLQVEIDLRALRDTLKQVLPSENIAVEQSGASVLLTGTVSSKEVAERVEALAKVHSKNVVNLLTELSDQVLLQVRFAEVDRTAIEQLGLMLFSTGAANTHGAISTQQFSQTLGNVGAVPAEVQRGRDPQSPSLVSGAKVVPPELSPATFGLSDLLNVFFFRPDVNFGATIRALQQRNVLQILAEPNLLARNGREASFLAGGEFPFPILQPSASGSAVTIQFKEFGVRLKFTPTILGNGTVGLKVAQEVSSLDFSNALTISGFVIPALSTRRTETELQLRHGQTFAIAGLIDNRLTEVASKIPGLGHLPIIGKLFRSRGNQRNKSELLALVTPLLMKPIDAGQPAPPGPTFPEPFLDERKGSGERPGTGSKP